MADQILAQTRAVTPQLKTVSIIVNNYNYGRFLGDAIDSALAQTYPHVEVIVVDDGSTDNSRQVIARYGDRITPVLKENGGQASALNAGFAASREELVLFLDSDDVLLPIAAQAAVRKWRDGLALLYFPLEVMDEHGRPMGSLVGGNPLPNPMLGPFSPGSPTSGNVFSRELLGRAMPIPELEWRICAESYATRAAALLGEAMRLDVPLGRYRVHGKNNFAHKEADLSDIRRALSAAPKFHSSMCKALGEKMPPFDDWLSADPMHWMARIRYFREAKADHPCHDTLPDLVRRAVRATWRNPQWNFRRRLAYTALVLCYGLAPKKIAYSVKRVESRTSNPHLRFLLGRKRREYQAGHRQ